MPLISMANVACGFHAGDPVVMRQTVALAKLHGVRVGAHPAYPDLQGFGRRAMDMDADELTAAILYQAGALKAFLDEQDMPLTHLKPHGALYGRAAKDEAIAARRRGRRRGPRRPGDRDGRHAARVRLHGPRTRVPGGVLRRSRLRRRRLAAHHAHVTRPTIPTGARACRPRAARGRRDSRSRAGRSPCARTACAFTPTPPAPRSSRAPWARPCEKSSRHRHDEEPMAEHEVHDPGPGDVLPPPRSRQRPVRERGRHRRGRRHDRAGGDHEELPGGRGARSAGRCREFLVENEDFVAAGQPVAVVDDGA